MESASKEKSDTLKKIKPEELKEGQEYIITHKRKGTFSGRFGTQTDVWADFVITAGQPKYAASYPLYHKEVGEIITVRKEFCSFHQPK